MISQAYWQSLGAKTFDILLGALTYPLGMRNNVGEDLVELANFAEDLNLWMRFQGLCPGTLSLCMNYESHSLPRLTRILSSNSAESGSF